MLFRLSRRNLFRIAPLTLPWSRRILAASPETAMLTEMYPVQPVGLVRETVTVAHGNVKRLRELVDAHPALAKAAVDWGFGDWEDALGAASHVGNREIAEYLISKGARPTLFSAAMLGHLDTVKAFVAAQPGAQRIPGPHSISLLAHAQAGGASAEPVLQYLESVGDAGAPTPAPLTDEERNGLVGNYAFGSGPADRIEITTVRNQLMFKRSGTTIRGLIHLGEHAFHPAGASAVRIRFAAVDGTMTLTIHDPDLVLTARAISETGRIPTRA